MIRAREVFVFLYITLKYCLNQLLKTMPMWRCNTILTLSVVTILLFSVWKRILWTLRSTETSVMLWFHSPLIVWMYEFGRILLMIHREHLAKRGKTPGLSAYCIKELCLAFFSEMKVLTVFHLLLQSPGWTKYCESLGFDTSSKKTWRVCVIINSVVNIELIFTKWPLWKWPTFVLIQIFISKAFIHTNFIIHGALFVSIHANSGIIANNSNSKQLYYLLTMVVNYV